MNKLYKKTSLILFGFLIAAVFSEIFLEILGFPASSIYRVDEKTGLLTFKPNSEIYIRSECFSNIIETNSLGFHSKEYSIEKPEGVFRIAIIGDSFIEASQVSIEKSFVYLLEKKLNSQPGSRISESNFAAKKFRRESEISLSGQPEKKYTYEVIPFGISSHGTYKSLLYLKAYVLNFRPDLVVAAYSLNDLEDDFGEEIKFVEDGQPVLEIKPVGSRSTVQKTEDFLKRNLRKSVLVTTLRREILLLKSKLEKKTIADLLNNDPEFIDKAWDIEEKLLFSFSNTVKSAYSRFLLVSLADARAYSSIEDNEETNKLESIASRHSFSYFDLMPIFKENFTNQRKDFTWSCDGHWNEEGNELAAEALFEYLVDSNLIKK